MKKLLATVLIGAMLLLPTPALASTDARVNVEKVTFDKLETYIKNFNPQIRAANERVADITVPSDEDRKKLMELKSDLEELLQGYENAIKALGGEVPDIKSGNGSGGAQTSTTTGYMVLNDGGSNPGDGNQNPGGGSQNPGNGSLSDTQINLHLITIYSSLYISTAMNLASIEQQLNSFDENRDKAADAKYQAALQTELGTKQAVQMAEQMFVQYHSLNYQIEQMQARESYLRKQLRVMELYRELGLITASSVKELENGLKELENGLKALWDGQQTIIRQFNIMFNQNYDTELEIGEMPEFDRSVINTMDFEKDYKEAEPKSYSVRLEDESYYIDAAKRQFKLDFKNGYDKVLDKLESLELEELKLEKLQKDYEFAKLKYDLGLLSELKFSEQQLAYDEQKIKVQLAKNELFMAYRDYQWLKEGVTSASGSMAGQGATSGSMAGQGMSSSSASMAMY